MSNLNNNKINLILDDKKGNINLISTEKLPNNNNVDLNQQNSILNYSINDTDKIKNNMISNDLLNTKNEEDLNLSNMNIEQTKKFIQNADALFPDEENENQSQINNNNTSNNISINNINLNNSKIQDTSFISINEEKRIENANNLFGNSLSSSLKSSLNSEINQSLVSEKRKEVADELFQTISDTSSKKRSLNETIKSNKSTMSLAINNLSGSNLGLNINEIANKYADRDKIINENEEESNIINTCENIDNVKDNENDNNIKTNSIKNSQIKDSIKDSIKANVKDSIKESENEYDKDIEEQNDDDEISFKNSLIEFKNKFGNDKNKSNNLKAINASEVKDDNKNDNNLIKSFKKNDLVSNSKEFNNPNNVEEESKINNNKTENNINNISNSEINISNIDLGNLTNFNKNKVENQSERAKKDKEDIKRSIIDGSGNKIENNNNINAPQKKSIMDLFGKNKKKNNLKKKEEKKSAIIDREDSEEETSNDILNRIRINTNENNESSILNNQKYPSKISIDDDKNKKIELIKEKEHSIPNNMEEIDTNGKLINNNLISGKNAQQGGRSSLLSDKDNSFIKIIKKKRKKKDNEKEIKDKEDNQESQIIKKVDSNIEDIKRISSDDYNIFVKFDKTHREKELSFIDFLKQNNYINCSKENNPNRDGGTFFDKKNGIQIKAIEENSYFEKYIIGQETVYDLINESQSKVKYEIPFYYEIMNKTYEDNKDNFNLLFQYITNKDKDKIIKLYKSIKKSSNYYISPYLNDITNFYDDFKINSNNKTFDFIRYTIDEKEEDSFYRCFMFSLFEIYILNKKKDNINALIFDIFKLYDLYPSIFISNQNYNINYTLVFFSIFIDYIGLNLWEKAHDFFISFFSQLAQVLVSYMKYNIFLFLSKIYSEYKNDGTKKYLDQYRKIIIQQMEPTCIIFKLIPHIFGINLEIYYYENKTKKNFREENVSFTCSKLFAKNNVDTIYIIYYNNCYHIGYQKKIFDINKEIYKSIEENLNKKSPIQYMKKDERYCEECDQNTEYIEIINDNHKGICSNCLSNELDEFLIERVSFINHDYYISDFLNYSYYLRPIELFLKEPISIKNNIENNSITIKNIDYFIIYNKTFSQRISELLPGVGMKKMMKSNKQSDSINDIEGDNISNNINNNDDANCIKCKKPQSDLITITCGCKYCEDCLYELLNTITEGQIILNGYEANHISTNDIDKCPDCDKKINLDNIVLLLEEKGRNFEVEYNEAKIRMNNYCKTMCLDCTKKFTNEKSLEVGHNSKKEILRLNVMINKHCLKDLKRNIGEDLDIVPGLDYSESQHVICYDCYKKNKDAKIKRINEVEYKVITCNICSFKHYFNMKDWDKWNKSDACCKCIIF